MSSLSPSDTSFMDLAEVTMEAIFIRLPVKDLIRSTSVNKTWYSLINNPSFISSQISRCISHNKNVLLIIPPITSRDNYCSLISADTSLEIEKFDIPFVTMTHSLKLVSEVNGMLLLTDLHTHYASRYLYFWNPYVMRYKKVVSSCFKKLLDNHEKSYCVVGMGYDKNMDDYKVVRVVYVQDGQGRQFGNVAPKVEIYSFKNDTWRKLTGVGVLKLARDNTGTYFDGGFYWIDMKQPGTDEFRTHYGKELRILYFDFNQEVFGELKVPDDVPDDFGKFTLFKLMEFEGSLALCASDPSHWSQAEATYPYSLWLMRQENGEVCWTLHFNAVLRRGGSPLNITKHGTLIVESAVESYHALNDVTRIVSCNFKTMIHNVHKTVKYGGQSQFVQGPATVDTSFPESLIMYEGGKYLFKFRKVSNPKSYGGNCCRCN